MFRKVLLNVQAQNVISMTSSQARRGFATFTLPPLPYKRDALKPYISEETLDYHYGKHHATYVTKLNGFADSDPALAAKSLEEIIKTSSGGIFNNAAQIYNHTFYWNSLSPSGGGAPSGKIADLINRDFGSFEDFQKVFSDTAANHFGSGWVWLIQKEDGKLAIEQGHDAGCPLTEAGQTPILTCDVWEHAYYIDYRNVRPDYLSAFWKLVNWEFANANVN